MTGTQGATLAFVTSTPMTARDGSGTHVGISVLRAALQQHGYAVPLFTPTPSTRLLGHTVQRLGFNLHVGRAVARLRPDLVVGFDLDGFLLAGRHAPRRIAAIKGIIADELTYEEWAVRLSLEAQALCERVHVSRVPLVLVTSNFARQRLSLHYGVPVEKIRVVPEPIDLAQWDALFGAAPRSARPGFTILCVAHFYPRKSIGTLLSALVQVRRAHPEARLRLVGHGPEEQHLRLFTRRLGLEGAVDFLGHVPRADLAAEYRAADVFCLPSRQEGFGIVYLEAMAAGLPVVACAAAAVPEVVEDGRTGLLTSPLRPGELAAALGRLAEDAALRRRLGESGRRRAALYTPDRVATAFLRTLAEEGLLVAARPGQQSPASRLRRDLTPAGCSGKESDHA
jgi:phosphatidylinositol alpha-1,6-mannosyltransferase